MSRGSSTIDPDEFNEAPRNGNTEGSLPRSQVVDNLYLPEMPRTNTELSEYTSVPSIPRRRNYRPVYRQVYRSNPYRIWIYKPLDYPQPSRTDMNRIIFAIARAIRTKRSVPGVPESRPGIVYHRNGDYILLDVEQIARLPADADDT